MALFGNNQLRNELQLALSDAHDETMDEPPELIRGCTEEEYVEHILAEYGMERVNVGYEDAYLEDEHRSPRKPRYLVLPAAGNLELLQYDPRGDFRGISFPSDIIDEGYRIRLDRSQARGRTRDEALQEQIDSTLETIRKEQKRIEERLDEHDEQLRKLAKKRYNNRQTEIKQRDEVYKQIDIPVRKREDVPKALDVDVPTRREPIDVEEFRDGSDLEWRMPMDAYIEVLEATNNLGKAFSRRPDLFGDYAEEDLRDLMLFFLEENFIGSATGETFNKRGKVDITLSTTEKPVFLAECAIWGGPQTITEKINQLFDYLTWRDSKAAIILFVGRKQFSAILEKIPRTVEDHPQCRELVEQKGETWWQYNVEHPDTPGAEIQLGVQAYHIPTLEDNETDVVMD